MAAANWSSCADVCGTVTKLATKIDVCCVYECKLLPYAAHNHYCFQLVDLPPGGLEEWWWPWVSAGAGFLVGLLVALLVVWVATQLVRLCTRRCDARRAWPNLWCWGHVRRI